eukprot:1158882-Pelagomonas_calceolata.AAC.2
MQSWTCKIGAIDPSHTEARKEDPCNPGHAKLAPLTDHTHLHHTMGLQVVCHRGQEGFLKALLAHTQAWQCPEL